MTDPMIFDAFGIYDNYAMGSTFCCLFIPEGHYFISTLWVRSTDEYINLLF